MIYKLLLSGYSEKHVRPSNQDRIYPAPETLPVIVDLPTVIGIADGMGGTQGGEQAAELALSQLSHSLLNTDLSAQGCEPNVMIEKYFHDANQRIIEHVGGEGISGSTLSILLFMDAQFWIGHIGDSRIYLLRNKQLYRLTQDDNAFSRHLREGYIALQPRKLPLSPEDISYLEQNPQLYSELFLNLKQIQAKPPSLPLSSTQISELVYNRIAEFHSKNLLIPVGSAREKLTAALGKKMLSHSPVPFLPVQIKRQLQPADLFLLCSDGLHGVVDDKQLQQRLQQISEHLDATTAQTNYLSWGSDMLLRDAHDHGSDDNISILLAQVIASNKPSKNDKAVNTLSPTTQGHTQGPSPADPTAAYTTEPLVPLPSPSPADPTAAYTTEPLVPLPSPRPADPTAAYTTEPLVPLPSPSPADPTAAYTTEPLVPLPSPSLADPTAAYKLKGLDDAYQAYDLVIDAHNSPTDGNKQETAAKQNIAMADLSKSSGYCDKTNSNPDTFDLELHTDPLQRFSASKDHNACLPYNSTDSPAVPNATRHQTHLSSNGEPILLRQSMIKHTHFIKDISPNWHLYAIIAILTAIILALWFWPTNPPITPEIKTQKPVELTNSHAVTLFLAQVPTFDQNNITQHRLEAIHTLNRDYAVITSLWQLAPELLRSWQKYLSAKVISHQNFLKVAQHIPFEPSNFKDIDRSIYMAALAMFEIIAPDYLRYLDEIEGPIALPPSSPQNSPSPLFQQQYRQLLVRNWLNIAPKLGWKSWQLQLLAERTLCHTPQAPKSKLNASMAQKFKPCLEYLNQAHGILLQNEPQHPILPQILNRIQIYQALLQKSQAK